MSAEAAGNAAGHEAVGRRKDAVDVLASRQARHLAQTFDRDPAGLEDDGVLPPGWHWLYFLDAPPTGVLGEDGRTVPGGFLPETGLPRRMWASGSFRFEDDLRLGRPATCTTTIAEVAHKTGRSGKLCFITTEHRVAQDDRDAIVETRNLVFREAPRPGEAARRVDPPGEAVWRREITPDAVLLFRFSALTFNAHRIHYDIDYCRDVEGYPGLVVHGPMLALLLLDLAERMMPGRRFRRFDYRAVAPLFTPDRFSICGRPDGDDRALLWIEGPDGALATTAELALA